MEGRMQMAGSILIPLLRAAVCGKAPDEYVRSACTPEMLDAVYELAAGQDLAHMAGAALEGLGLPDGAAMEKFRVAGRQAIYRYLRQDHAYGQICQTLERNRIPFVPLKGSVLREYYPERWMRTSCDIDILVRESDLDPAIQALTKAGWAANGERGYHDISLYSPAGVHLELHFHIREHIDRLEPLLEQVWDHAAPAAGKQYEHALSNEYLMFHLLAHMSYHFVCGGCGVRPLLDLWILKRRMGCREDVLGSLCRQGGLDKFHDQLMALAGVWFEDRSHSEVTRRLEQVLFQGGIYGSSSNKVLFDQAQAGSKFGNLRRRIFQPYRDLCIQYPAISRYPWLTPVYQIVRWWRIASGGKLIRSCRELRMNQKLTGEQMRSAEAFLCALGLEKSRYRR